MRWVRCVRCVCWPLCRDDLDQIGPNASGLLVRSTMSGVELPNVEMSFAEPPQYESTVSAERWQHCVGCSASSQYQRSV